jgi:beta-galactosidase
MKPFALGLLLAFSMVARSAQYESIDLSWKFARFGSMPDGSQKPEPTDSEKSISSPRFDDSKWRTVNLPHDWGIEGPFRADLPNRTGKLPWVGIG